MDDRIETERLALPLLTATRLTRLLAGDLGSVEAEIEARLGDRWISDLAWLVQVRLNQINERPANEPWLLRPIIRRGAEPLSIGLINFHGAPDDRGFVEVGYELWPEHRGQGYAIEAVRALFDWAARERGVDRFRAAIAPDNDRSLKLVAKLGMRRVGAQWDPDDGLELIYVVDGWTDGAAA